MFTVKIDTDNAAYTDSPEYEIASNLEAIVEDLKFGVRRGRVMDHNGNTVGTWELSED